MEWLDASNVHNIFNITLTINTFTADPVKALHFAILV